MLISFYFLTEETSFVLHLLSLGNICGATYWPRWAMDPLTFEKILKK